MNIRRFMVAGVLSAGLCALAFVRLRALEDDGARSEPARAALSAKASEAELVLAAEDAAAPWAQADGTGYANDVVRAAFRAVGVTVRFAIVPYARCKQMVLDGTIAGCFVMSPHPDLAGSVVFPEVPLFVCHSDFVLRANEGQQLESVADIKKGTVAGVVLGYEYAPALYDLVEKGILTLDTSRSEELNLKKLAEGRIDAAIVNDNDTKTLAYMQAKGGVHGRVRLAFELGELKSYIGFSRMHPRGMRALAQFSEGLHMITESGEMQRIDEAWAQRARSQTALWIAEKASPREKDSARD